MNGDERPPAHELLPVMFEAVRLRPQVRSTVICEVRCARRRHLLVVVVGTKHGRWVAWRNERGVRDHMDPWGANWLDDLLRLSVAKLRTVSGMCPCRWPPAVSSRTGRTYDMDARWLASQRGVVLANTRAVYSRQ